MSEREFIIRPVRFYQNDAETGCFTPYALPEARVLLQGGVAGLVELARARGIVPDPGGYYLICDLCRSIRRAMAEG